MKNMTKIETLVTERVKTFGNACREIGYDHRLVLNYLDYVECCEENCDYALAAFLQLRIICAALNDGWEPQFTEDEERWLPYHSLFTQDELNGKDDEWKRRHTPIDTGDYLTEYAGFAFDDSLPNCSGASFPSSLFLKSEALSDYCGRQFIRLWADLKLPRKP